MVSTQRANYNKCKDFRPGRPDVRAGARGLVGIWGDDAAFGFCTEFGLEGNPSFVLVMVSDTIIINVFEFCNVG